MSERESRLMEAYRESVVTVYLASGAFKCSPNTALSTLPQELHPCTWVITAHNPHSRVLSAEANSERQGRLIVLLREMLGATIYPAVGASESGDWSEASFAVVGVEFEAIAEVARHFEQNAIYRIDKSGCSVACV